MPADLQGAFRALADPTRRQILMDLSTRDMTIGEVAEQFEITRGAVKKHLTILAEGKLISVRAKGRTRINRLEPLGLKSVVDWFNYFDNFWDDRLNNLKNAIERESRNKHNV
ncbi:MAG: metalloregulator ArsR/SmtB family transcription factor [Gammaproteobacteria bacterium]|nr:metalloregulator ArsR/SmtB family transcription factor [Gammaproteobacteria bacterium]